MVVSSQLCTGPVNELKSPFYTNFVSMKPKFERETFTPNLKGKPLNCSVLYESLDPAAINKMPSIPAESILRSSLLLTITKGKQYTSLEPQVFKIR